MKERGVFFFFKGDHTTPLGEFYFFSLSRSPLIFIRWGAETPCVGNPVAGKRAKSNLVSWREREQKVTSSKK